MRKHDEVLTSEALDGVSKLGEFCFLFKTTPSDYNLFFGASFRKWSLMKLQAIPIICWPEGRI